MSDTPNIQNIARLLADTARAKILWTLIDSSARPAGELAYAANISAQSASAHLAKLVNGGLLECESQGRHRYFRIASADVAHLIESMASVSTVISPRVPRPASLTRSMPVEFSFARTCYDHLAGTIGVSVLDSLLEAGWLTREGRQFVISEHGKNQFTKLNVDIVSSQKRMFAPVCIDLTERRPHLGGALGANLLILFVSKRWILRSKGSRTVSVTPQGDIALKTVFKASRQIL
jgi:DNA-binding transcriptional ArsR family regulator